MSTGVQSMLFHSELLIFGDSAQCDQSTDVGVSVSVYSKMAVGREKERYVGGMSDLRQVLARDRLVSGAQELIATTRAVTSLQGFVRERFVCLHIGLHSARAIPATVPSSLTVSPYGGVWL
ncbi:hypothetical protein J6590_064276 [Homalodisca vitripennis]|nr:hypothetical protein J6590_064276 [Homalodisca vitripennis]